MRMLFLLAAVALLAPASAIAKHKPTPTKKHKPAPVTTTAAAAPAPLRSGSSVAYGTVMFDQRGFVLYAFTADERNVSHCYDACAKAWPPYLVTSAPSGKLLGVAYRDDGTLQLTFAGKPLYYYVGDGKGEIRCQNASEYGGLWLIVAPDGSYVR